MQQSRNTRARPGSDSVLDRPLSTRSVIASLLLGRRPPVRAGPRPGALVRAVRHRARDRPGGAAPDDRGRRARTARRAAMRSSGTLARRQEEQQASLRPATRRWDGTWRLAIAGGHDARPAPVRADMRVALRRARMAEWREGVWIRPANIDVIEDPRCAWLDARPEGDPVALARRLFAPAQWSRTATALIGRLADATARARRPAPDAIVPGVPRGRRRAASRARRPAAAGRAAARRLARRRAAAAPTATYERRFQAVAREFFRDVRHLSPADRTGWRPSLSISGADAAASRRRSASRRNSSARPPDRAHLGVGQQRLRLVGQLRRRSAVATVLSGDAGHR